MSSKITNKIQMDILLLEMQSNPAIACGMFKGSRDELNEFWRNLEIKLNSAGPPTKHVAEWKKVWSDQKKYVRKKAAKILKHTEGTGVKPSMKKKFSASKEAINNLIGMKECVEDVANTFGLGSSFSNSYIFKEHIEAADQAFLANDNKIDLNESFKKNPSQPPAKKIKKTPTELPAQNPPANVLADDICIHRNMLEMMKEQHQSTKEIYRSLNRLYDLKKEELEEKKRHNMVMEKLRLREIIINCTNEL